MTPETKDRLVKLVQQMRHEAIVAGQYSVEASDPTEYFVTSVEAAALSKCAERVAAIVAQMDETAHACPAVSELCRLRDVVSEADIEIIDGVLRQMDETPVPAETAESKLLDWVERELFSAWNDHGMCDRDLAGITELRQQFLRKRKELSK